MDKTILIAFNKPYGVLSQFSGEGATLADFNLPKEVYAAGRLDKDSEGLLLLTNNGRLNQKIAHPKFHKQKIYHAQVENIPSDDKLTQFSAGLDIKNYRTKPCQVQRIPDPNYQERVPPIRKRLRIPTCWLEIRLSEGKNRQVRRMTAAIGHPTLRLIRVACAGIALPANLAPGSWLIMEPNLVKH